MTTNYVVFNPSAFALCGIAGRGDAWSLSLVLAGLGVGAWSEVGCLLYKVLFKQNGQKEVQ